MKWLRGFLFRLGGLFRRERRERELAAEMESHLQMHIEDNLRSGVESRGASAERGPADSCCGSCSRQATNQLNTFRCEAAGMTRRNAILTLAVMPLVACATPSAAHRALCSRSR